MLHAAGITRIRQRARQRGRDPQAIIEQAQQHRASVAAAAWLIEVRLEWLHERSAEQNVSGRAMLAHQKASTCRKWRVVPYFYHTEGLLAMALANNPH